jgi:hypothetical protein
MFFTCAVKSPRLIQAASLPEICKKIVTGICASAKHLKKQPRALPWPFLTAAFAEPLVRWCASLSRPYERTAGL